jgi:chorismate mutase
LGTFYNEKQHFRADMSNPAITIKELIKDKPLLLAGPCSAESHDQLLSTAKELSSFGVKIFRAGIWKPRTKPGGFEGVGREGLKWMAEVKELTGMLTATEVANSKHVKEALKGGIDILWIGARTTGNPFAVQEIADSLKGKNIPVFVKNPLNADPDLWVGAIERLQNSGISEVAAVHRGFSTYEKGLFRNLPQWHIPIEVKRRMPSLVMICDPSHIGGRPDLIYPLSQHALDMGFDGLMIESHIEPAVALSDKEQQITPAMLRNILKVLVVREKSDCSESLSELRREIDEMDERLLDIISKRMAISREIGRYKKENNIPVLQPLRYDRLVSRRISQAAELMIDEEFIKLILEAIHEESVRQQIEIFNKE